MSRKNVRGLMFSMEDLDETVVENGDGLGVDPDVIEDASDIDADTEAFSENADNLSALESIAIAIEETLENDGLSEDAAKIADISIEHICNRLGMKNTKLLVATEQFGSSNTRLAATRISLEEGMWDTIKGGWDKMIQWIKEQCGKIADFFRKLISGFSWQMSQVEKFDEKITLLKSNKFEASFKDAGLCEKFRFSSNGTTATGKDCVETLNNTVSVVNSISGSVKSFKVDKGNTTIFHEVAGKNVLLSGQKYVVDKDSGQMQLLSPPSGGGSSSECKTMKPDELKAAIASCKTLLKVVEEMVTKDVDIKRIEKDLITEIKKAQSEASSAEEKQQQKNRKETISANAKSIFSVSGKIPKLAIQTVSASLSYISKSLAQYQKD